MRNKKPEQVLTDRVVILLQTKYEGIPYRIDIVADMPLPMHLRLTLGRLHGEWATGYPDVLILSCRGGYGGLFLELKATEDVPNSKHTRNQARYHKVLREMGYKAMFVCGFDEAKKAIKKYMKLKKNKI